MPPSIQMRSPATTEAGCEKAVDTSQGSSIEPLAALDPLVETKKSVPLATEASAGITKNINTLTSRKLMAAGKSVNWGETTTGRFIVRPKAFP